ncbi:MAG: hypothetical protein LBD30_04555 [Verrucomicrobiales bacterium]|nr:hypothetical protein [Verrucomicrobiales bacterium]
MPRLPGALLMASVAAHALVLGMAGGWVIGLRMEEHKTPSAFTEQAALVQDEWNAPDPPEPDEFNSEPLTDDSAPPLMMTDFGGMGGGVEFSPFVTAVPVGVIGGLLPESSAPSGGGTGAADGDGRQARGTGKITVGNIFNTRVESAKLGVLLDVSSSAHAYLPLTVSEIERHFGDAVIVLAYGCGMYDKTDPDRMYVKELSRCKTDTAGARNTLGQIAKADGDAGDLFKKLRTRPHTYVLYAENCGHTHYGFKKLLDERVDTVYWFADFHDKISNRVASKLVKELQARGVKVIAHNFTGKPVPEAGEQIALATNGNTIAKVPGGGKRK